MLRAFGVNAGDGLMNVPPQRISTGVLLKGCALILFFMYAKCCRIGRRYKSQGIG